MASTSTNKQPLFIDRVFHYVKDLDKAFNGQTDPDNFLVSGNNNAANLVDAIGSDGAIIEDIYVISKGAAYTVNLYLSSARDFLRATQSAYIGSITSSATSRAITRWDETENAMPKTLAPVPQVAADPKNTALYIPKGSVLWAARQGNLDVTDGPLIGCQGGWY